MQRRQQRYLITDMGTEQRLYDAKTNELVQVLGRYAAWTVHGNILDEVVEVSSDLEMLKSKYGVTEEVILIRKGGEEHEIAK